MTDSLGNLLWMLWVLSFIYKNKWSRKLRAVLRCSLTHLANAAAHVSVERRKCIMKSLNSDLKALAEGPFPDRSPDLFGKSLHRWPSFAAPGQEKAERILNNSLVLLKWLGFLINYPKCFFTELDQYPRLCTSSLLPNFTIPSESSGDKATVVLITHRLISSKTCVQLASVINN